VPSDDSSRSCVEQLNVGGAQAHWLHDASGALRSPLPWYAMPGYAPGHCGMDPGAPSKSTTGPCQPPPGMSTHANPAPVQSLSAQSTSPSPSSSMPFVQSSPPELPELLDEALLLLELDELGDPPPDELDETDGPDPPAPAPCAPVPVGSKMPKSCVHATGIS